MTPSGADSSGFTLIHVVPSGEWGGPERYAFDICRYFNEQGWHVRALTRDARAVDSQFVKYGINVVHAPLRPYPDYYSARKLAMLFKSIPCEKGIVHVHRYNDALTCIIARKIARRSDIRLVATRHKAEKGLDGLLRRIIYRGIDRHLFVSEFARTFFYEGWEPGASPLDISKTAVSFNSFLHSAECPAEEPTRGPIAAAYRGKLKPGKGLETLIDALSLIKEHVRLKIIGKGHPDYVDRLRQRAYLAGVADRIDWIRNTEFADYKMGTVHFGILPSEEPEAFGMSNLEFMACGKPQISTFSGAEKEMLIPGEDSIEVKRSNPAMLAHAIDRLATDPELRIRLGQKAFERYQALFSWPHFLEKLLPSYLGSNNMGDVYGNN